ncbi:vacuolar iron transporter homolog 2.1-like [Tripterygium wilfordii]|uniref:vacuolar iron transporter homolog 2.1-like n=1 Tax=Tripterygium wilfordii TaxID=458696 RepID=UPI0018F850C8|nr:vacuolar iron transporter homolog 2.1-like [Tripterygium wilfordii]
MASSEKVETSVDVTVVSLAQRAEVVERAQWLRAAILGATDGLISTASLLLGVGAATEDRWSMILSGLAGSLAGACSMAVGEFVSVSTQRDIEKKTTADHCTHQSDDHGNIKLVVTSTTATIETNLTASNKQTPSPSPHQSPALKMLTEDAKKHVLRLQDKYESEEPALPNPYKAAAASALAFLCGSVLPLALAIFVPNNGARMVATAVVTSIALALFGGIGAHLGGLPIHLSAVKVLVGGWIAMAITYGLLKPFNTDDHPSSGHTT